MKNIIIISFCLLSQFCLNAILAQSKSGLINIKNGELYYEIYGEGEPIVFLNGGPGISSNSYKYIPEKFDSNHQVILFDQRGTGKSKLKEINKHTITIKHMVKDLEKLRNHLKIDKWNVVGQSFGGTYAMAYAAKHHQFIDKLILISSGGFESKTIHKFQKFQIPDVDKMTTHELNLLDTIVEMSKDTSADLEQLQKYRTAMLSRYYIYNWDNLDKQINWFSHAFESNFFTKMYVNFDLKKINLKRKLKKVLSSTLILYGLSDFIPFNIPKSIHETLPNSELKTFENCGHSIWLDKEKEMKETIREFLNKHDEK